MNLLDETTKELFQTEALAAYNEALAGVGSTGQATSKKTAANVPF